VFASHINYFMTMIIIMTTDNFDELVLIKINKRLQNNDIPIDDADLPIIFIHFTTLIKKYCAFFNEYCTTSCYMATLHLIHNASISEAILSQIRKDTITFNVMLKDQHMQYLFFNENDIFLFSFDDIVDIFEHEDVSFIDDKLDCIHFSELLDYLLGFMLFIYGQNKGVAAEMFNKYIY